MIIVSHYMPILLLFFLQFDCFFTFQKLWLSLLLSLSPCVKVEFIIIKIVYVLFVFLSSFFLLFFLPKFDLV